MVEMVGESGMPMELVGGIRNIICVLYSER